jgi:hypothetical protein
MVRQRLLFASSRVGRSSGIWSQQQKLTASDGAAGDEFGSAIALSSDGNTVLAGAPDKTVGQNYYRQGAAYVFIQPVVTITGSPQQPLTKDAEDFIAQVTVTNTGNVTINSLQITGATLGSGSLSSAPAPVTNLAPGASVVMTLVFPLSSVSPGTTSAPLELSGVYSVTTPALSGNWGLSFRSVTL